MLQKTKNKISWLEFEQLKELGQDIVHGSFLRHGGTSLGPYSTLNISYAVGDKEEHVDENRSRVLKILKKREKIISLVTAEQVHKDEIFCVTKKESFEAASCDALITQVPGAVLMIKHADCQAAILYDPMKKALAVVHSGWKGSCLNIYKKTILHMREKFGSRPDDILVSISPSLGPEASEFKNFKEELPEEFWDFQIKPFYFDFWAISDWQLKAAAILPHHIEIAKVCTYSNKEDFYSYRRERVTGRLATCAMLTSS
jgi:polyphenol oxidase